MRSLALLFVVLALAIAGCGGDDEAETGTGATEAQPTATATESAPSASGETFAIAMKDIQFDPAEAEVEVGQKVVWTNDDEAPHNVVGGPIESPNFGKGETFEFTPEEAGTIEYVCTLHPGMEGTLTVVEP